MRAALLTQFSIEEPTPGYRRVVFSNPPINLMNSTTVLELSELPCGIEEGCRASWPASRCEGTFDSVHV